MSLRPLPPSLSHELLAVIQPDAEHDSPEKVAVGKLGVKRRSLRKVLHELLVSLDPLPDVLERQLRPLGSTEPGYQPLVHHLLLASDDLRQEDLGTLLEGRKEDADCTRYEQR